jgi:hypothetical protein
LRDGGAAEIGIDAFAQLAFFMGQKQRGTRRGAQGESAAGRSLGEFQGWASRATSGPAISLQRSTRVDR